jgi:hypothetical protein
VLPSLPSRQADNAAMYVQAQGRGYVYMSGGYHGHKYSPHYDHNLYRYADVLDHTHQHSVILSEAKDLLVWSTMLSRKMSRTASSS